MSSRTDHVTAEKVSIVLLTRAAFGTEAAVRAALLYGVTPTLVESVLRRPQCATRPDVAESCLSKDRRKDER
jgi:hypothetical protein